MAQGTSQSERADMLAFKRGTGPEPATSWGSGSAIPGTRRAAAWVTVLVNEPFAGTDRWYVKYSCGHANLYPPSCVQNQKPGDLALCYKCGEKKEVTE